MLAVEFQCTVKVCFPKKSLQEILKDKRKGEKSITSPRQRKSVGSGPKPSDYNWAESNINAYYLTLQQGHGEKERGDRRNEREEMDGEAS